MPRRIENADRATAPANTAAATQRVRVAASASTDVTIPNLSGGSVLVRILVAGVLLAGPTALAFASGGFFDRSRTVAGVAAWALVALLAVTGAPLPRSRAAWAALAGLGGLAAWAAISLSWAPLTEPGRDDVGRLILYTGALLASAMAWADTRDVRLVEPALAGGALVVCLYGMSDRLLPGLIDLEQSATAAGRLEQPLTYWNGMGVLGALGLTLAIRVAGTPTRPPSSERLRLPPRRRSAWPSTSPSRAARSRRSWWASRSCWRSARREARYAPRLWRSPPGSRPRSWPASCPLSSRSRAGPPTREGAIALVALVVVAAGAAAVQLRAGRRGRAHLRAPAAGGRGRAHARRPRRRAARRGRARPRRRRDGRHRKPARRPRQQPLRLLGRGARVVGGRSASRQRHRRLSAWTG